MERFIKANPNRPEAIQEAARLSEEQALEAQYAVLRATYITDKAEKAATLAKARKIFEEVRPRFVEAEKAAAKLLAALPAKSSRRREHGHHGGKIASPWPWSISTWLKPRRPARNASPR